jgi:hypothetical protein
VNPTLAPRRTTRGQTPENTRAAVDATARFCLNELHEMGLTDNQILDSVFTSPHPKADARFDRDQEIKHGYVPAPALAVKARMKELLAN